MAGNNPFADLIPRPDGHSSPDSAVSVGNRERQAVARRAMAGRDPTLTPEERDDVQRRAGVSEQNNQAFERGVGELVLGQPVRAVKAIGSAYDDPTLGNVANAALQTGLAAAPALPLRYAAPLIGTDIARQTSGEASAQGSGAEARMRQMSQQELMAYQRSIGVNPDGRIGPETLKAALLYEAQQKARADQASEADRIRAQGETSVALERARILAQGEAESGKARAASELSAEEAQRPFLQRNPGYSTYAPYVAGAAAAALPFVGAVLSRRSATMPARQQARSIDAAVDGFNAAPTPLTARTASQAVSQPPVQAAQPSVASTILDYGSLGVGASLPSAAVVAPYFVDYMQPAGTEANKRAAEQFTVPKLVERMTGPFALGMAMAGGGRFLGEKAGQAFINPAPRGANMAQAKVLDEMVRKSPDDVALTDNLLNLIKGGQSSVLEAKRLAGAINASPPRVSFNDIEVGNIAKPPRSGRAGSGSSQGARALPESDPGASTKSLPPPDRVAAPEVGPSQPPSIPPGREPTNVPSPKTRSGSSFSDPQRLEVQERLLGGATVEQLAQQYGVSKASIASVQRNTEEIVKNLGGDRGEALRQIQEYKKFRKFTYAAPLAVGSLVSAQQHSRSDGLAQDGEPTQVKAEGRYLSQARNAIYQQGKDRKAVEDKLRELGVDPGKIDGGR